MKQQPCTLDALQCSGFRRLGGEAERSAWAGGGGSAHLWAVVPPSRVRRPNGGTNNSAQAATRSAGHELPAAARRPVSDGRRPGEEDKLSSDGHMLPQRLSATAEEQGHVEMLLCSCDIVSQFRYIV
jgi:hypothetical protein